MASGIAGDGQSGVTIEGNKIGTDITGTVAIGNLIGIDHAANALIGGTDPGAGNLISGNSLAGISSADYYDLIQGNFIGTDVTGTVVLGNQTGINDPEFATIGGTTPAARNVISGNNHNIAQAYNDLIEGNYLGTDVTGEVGGFPFADVTGIMHAYNTTIGGTAAGAGNLISGNNSIGIRSAVNCLIQGNFIGTNKEGTKAVGNQLGIEYDGATQSLADTIGGTATGAGNLISGNYIGITCTAGRETCRHEPCHPGQQDRHRRHGFRPAGEPSVRDLTDPGRVGQPDRWHRHPVAAM